MLYNIYKYMRMQPLFMTTMRCVEAVQSLCHIPIQLNALVFLDGVEISVMKVYIKVMLCSHFHCLYNSQ